MVDALATNLLRSQGEEKEMIVTETRTRTFTINYTHNIHKLPFIMFWLWLFLGGVIILRGK